MLRSNGSRPSSAVLYAKPLSHRFWLVLSRSLTALSPSGVNRDAEARAADLPELVNFPTAQEQRALASRDSKENPPPSVSPSPSADARGEKRRRDDGACGGESSDAEAVGVEGQAEDAAAADSGDDGESGGEEPAATRSSGASHPLLGMNTARRSDEVSSHLGLAAFPY